MGVVKSHAYDNILIYGKKARNMASETTPGGAHKRKRFMGCIENNLPCGTSIRVG